MANGHGGKRAGAGRKKKPLTDKILEGSVKKHKPKVLDLPGLEASDAPEPPDYLEHFNSGDVSEDIPSMQNVFYEVTDWLEKTGCLHLISPVLITEYALLKTRWLECEALVANVLLYPDRNGSLWVNPMAELGLKYYKSADIAWSKIWNIVAQNSEVSFGNDPQADFMEKLLKMNME